MSIRDCPICGEILTNYQRIKFCYKCKQFYKLEQDQLVKVQLVSDDRGDIYFQNEADLDKLHQEVCLTNNAGD